MSNLVNVSYVNLETEIKTKLAAIPLIAAIDDDNLTLARTERTKLSNLIKGYEANRIDLKKVVDDNFKALLKDAVDRLAKFDENIKNGAEDQRIRRTKEIKDFISETSENTINLEVAPIADFLKNYDGYKTQVKNWVSKIKSSIIKFYETFGEEAVKDFHTHYNDATTYDRFVVKATPQAPAVEESQTPVVEVVAPKESVGQVPVGSPSPVKKETFSTFTITVADSIKDEIIAYLENRGVLVG